MIKNAGFKNRNTKITHNVWVNLFCSGGVLCSGARGGHIDADGGRGPETPAWNQRPAPAARWAWRGEDALAGPRWSHLALSFLCAAVVPCQPFSGGRLWGSSEPPVAEVSLLLPSPHLNLLLLSASPVVPFSPSPSYSPVSPPVFSFSFFLKNCGRIRIT